MEISVVIPFYNCEKWLAECIDSVLSLDKVHEVILIDDGSTDGSYSIAERMALHDRRIAVVRHPDKKNHGRSASRNRGWQLAGFEWIAFLDADDLYTAERFDDDYAVEGADGYYSSMTTLYQSPQYSKFFAETTTEVKGEILPIALLDHLILHTDQRISLNTLLIRKKCLEAIGGFDESLDIGEDTDLIWRLADRFNLYKEKRLKAGAIRRIHGNNTAFIPELHHYKYLFYKKWKDYIRTTHANSNSRKKIFKSYLYFHPCLNKTEKRTTKIIVQLLLSITHYLRIDLD